jgi:glycosidase
MKLFHFFILLILGVKSYAQIDRVEPPNWWVGMQMSKLQIMMYGDNLAVLDPKIDSEGVKLIAVDRVENKNYIFLTLEISKNAIHQNVNIDFYNGKKLKITHEYELLPRKENAANIVGFSPKDVMYLITPDRFVNGDTENDELSSMKEKLGDGDYDRHGGDLQGIMNHLDYIHDLGFTAIWLNPALENNMEEASYHGYSTTDYYKIDPRYGSNEKFRELTHKAGEKGIKIIMDVIPNHCGSEHWFFIDPPMNNWFNNQDNYTNTTHIRQSIQDIHASEFDKRGHADGWFVETMPDLNQKNPLVSKYLIQNAIWWIEYAGLSGLRVDTYPYADRDFMGDWTRDIMAEYPLFNIVGEEWSENPAITSYWQMGKQNHDDYVSYLPSLMDFPLQIAFVEALNDDFGWGKGFIKAYRMLANDFLYADPYNLVIFPDNHDMTRFYTQVNNDLDLFNMGIVYYATMRGIPQFFYGTEILMNSNENPGNHGLIRSNFPGGFPGDKINAFTREGLNVDQIKTLDFFKKILKWRKSNEAIHHGKLIQFAPKPRGKEEIYSYFRIYEGKKVWILFNRTNQRKEVEMYRYKELIENHKQGFEVISDQKIDFKNNIIIEAKSSMIIELNP